MTGVMEDKAIFDTPAIRYPGITASPCQSSSDTGDVVNHITFDFGNPSNDLRLFIRTWNQDNPLGL
jgi:hypothetical protein